MFQQKHPIKKSPILGRIFSVSAFCRASIRINKINKYQIIFISSQNQRKLKKRKRIRKRVRVIKKEIRRRRKKRGRSIRSLRKEGIKEILEEVTEFKILRDSSRIGGFPLFLLLPSSVRPPGWSLLSSYHASRLRRSTKPNLSQDNDRR